MTVLAEPTGGMAEGEASAERRAASRNTFLAIMFRPVDRASPAD
jgi:hypothetical protein